MNLISNMKTVIDQALVDSAKIRECKRIHGDHKFTRYVQKVEPDHSIYAHGYRYYYQCKFCPVLKPFKRKKRP